MMNTTSGGVNIELGAMDVTMDLDTKGGGNEKGFTSSTYYAMPKKLTEKQEKVLADIFPLLHPNCDIKKDFERTDSFIEKLGKSGDKIIRNELLRRAVETRNNKIIIGVLDFIQDCLSNSRARFNDPEPVETIEMVCLRVIILLTINNDSESLEEVLTWKKDNRISLTELPKDKVSYPLLVAANEDYTFCLRMLYKDQFNIRIDPADKNNIDKLMKDDWGIDSPKKIRFLRFFNCCSRNNVNDDLTYLGLIKSEKCEQDPVQRFMTLSTFTNPTYISIAYKENCLSNSEVNSEPEKCKLKSQSDPLRTAFACATYAKYLAGNNPQYSKQYEKISNKCEEFATDLLNHCQSNDEIDILLQDKAKVEPPLENEDEPDGLIPCSNPSGDDWAQTDIWEENKNWNIALWEEHQSFVSHHYFQEFINRKLWPSWKEKNFGSNSVCFSFPIAIIIFFLYPFVTIADMLFGNADILFLNPNHPKMGKKTENFIFSFFRQRIHRPIYRILVDVFFEVIFLVNLRMTIWDTDNIIGKPAMELYDYTFVYLVIAYLTDDIIEIFRHPYSSFWKKYAFLTHFCFFVGFILQGSGSYWKRNNDKALMSGDDPVMVGTALICFAAAASIYRTVNWLLVFKSTGPVVIGLTKVIQDIIVVIYLLLIVFAAFLVGFYGMFHIYHDQNRHLNYTLDSKHQDLSTIRKAIPSMVWSILNPDAIPMIKRNQTTEMKDGNLTSTSIEMVDSWEFYHLMAVFMCLVYHVMVAIILINILITLMSATYSKISVNADMYWKFSRTFKLTAYLSPRTTFPPPFRPIYYLAKLFYKKKGERNEFDTNKNAYYDLLLDLVTRRDHIKDETSKEDELSDLRQDIKNLIRDQELQSQNISEKASQVESMQHQDIKKMIEDQNVQIKILTEKASQVESMQHQDIIKMIEDQNVQIKILTEKVSKTESMLETFLLEIHNLKKD